jgi:hypothetical protein
MRTIIKHNSEYKETHNVDIWNKIASIMDSVNKQPTIVNPDSKFVIVTYWWGRGNINKNTRKPCYDDSSPVEAEPIAYEKMIENWENTCSMQKCNYLAIEYPEFAQKGGYQLAINAKPLFIKKALELCGGRSVVYIDGDMTVNQYPHIFDMEGYDFMARHWNIDPRSSKHYKKTQCIDMTIFETSGGIMYFNYTIGSFGLLDKWIYHTFYKTNAGKADDRILSLIMSNKQYTYNLRIFMLPIEFLWLSDLYDQYLPRDNVIIEHPACLTTEEMAQEQGAANDREPKLYQKIVTDYIECSKYGGLLWEYIFFENEKQLESYKSYFAYLRSLTIDDAYEDRDSDDRLKPPYSFIDYNDKYGKYKFDNETFQSIADKNSKYVKIITELLNSKYFRSTKKLVYVAYKAGDRVLKSPNSLNDSTRSRSTVFVEINIDSESNKIVYSNCVNCTIIALLNMGYEVLYLPNVDSVTYVDKVMIEVSKNPDLELIFCNKMGYVVDNINILEGTPIYFKKGRVLMHLLNLVTNRGEFKRTFERVFKSSLLFVHCIRTGLFKKSAKQVSMTINVNNFPLKSLHKMNSPNSVNSAPLKQNTLSTRKSRARSAPTIFRTNDVTPDVKVSPKSIVKSTFNKIKLAHLRGQHEKKRDTFLADKK